MSIANSKRSKRRKTKPGQSGGDTGNTTQLGNSCLDIMKLKPEDQVPDASNPVVLTNGHVCDEKDHADVRIWLEMSCRPRTTTCYHFKLFVQIHDFVSISACMYSISNKF